MMNKIELLNNTKGKYKKKGFSLEEAFKKIIINVSVTEVLVFIMAVFIARASIMDSLTPFGLAIIGAYLLKHRSVTMVTLATTIGVISYQGTNSVYYIFAMWMLVITYKLLADKIKFTIFKIATIASLILLITKGAYIFLEGYYLYDIVMTAFEGIIVFSLIYIFRYSLSIIDGKYNRLLTSEEIICGAIMLSLTVSGFGDLTILNLSIKNIVGALIVMIIAYGKGASMGTAVGVTIGLVTGMSEPNMPLLISVYGFSGILSGLFRDLGKLGIGIGFLLGNGIMSFYINGVTDPVIQFSEVFVAMGLLIISSKIVNKFSDRVIIGTTNGTAVTEGYTERIRENAHKRLKEVSEVFEELAVTFNRVADKERIMEQRDISKFIDNVVEDTCKSCSMYPFCWGADFYSTYHLMFDIMSRIELHGEINEGNLPEEFKKRCIKPRLVMDKCNYLFDIYKLNYKWEHKILESRQLVSQQLEGVSKIIDDLAKEIYSDVVFKDDVEKAIYSQLADGLIDVKEVAVTESRDGKFEIYLDIKSCFGQNNCTDDIIPMVSDIVGFDLVRDSISCNLSDNKKRCRFKLIKANRYGAVTRVATSNQSFNYISGDNYTFGEKETSYFAALSDGMGVGQRANQESDITISLLEKFLEAGFDKELALKTINSILVLKSNDEIFSTIDMAIVDLFEGKSQFIKVGAASTFIKKRNEVRIINSQTLPLGILKDVDFQVYEEQLEDGDFIIMMSDGVLDANLESDDKEGWMIDIIDSIDSVNPQSIADQIILAAEEMADGQAKDDMTVLVTKVWRRR